MASPKIAIIISSTRQTRFGDKPAQWVYDIASQRSDMEVELIDLRTLRPLDVETIVKSISKTHRCVVIDEDYGYCGIGTAISGKVYKRVWDELDAPIEHVHSDEIPVPFNHYLEDAMMPSVEKIIASVKEVCYR